MGDTEDKRPPSNQKKFGSICSSQSLGRNRANGEGKGKQVDFTSTFCLPYLFFYFTSKFNPLANGFPVLPPSTVVITQKETQAFWEASLVFPK